MVIRVAGAAPDGVVHAERVVLETEDSAGGGKSSHETLRCDVLGADGASAELAYGSGFIFAFDTFHVEIGWLSLLEAISFAFSRSTVLRSGHL